MPEISERPQIARRYWPHARATKGMKKEKRYTERKSRDSYSKKERVQLLARERGRARQSDEFTPWRLRTLHFIGVFNFSMLSSLVVL